MTEIVENNIKIKICKTCGISSEFNKFNGKECIKCKSKKFQFYFLIYIV